MTVSETRQPPNAKGRVTMKVSKTAPRKPATKKPKKQNGLQERVEKLEQALERVVGELTKHLQNELDGLPQAQRQESLRASIMSIADSTRGDT